MRAETVTGRQPHGPGAARPHPRLCRGVAGGTLHERLLFARLPEDAARAPLGRPLSTFGITIVGPAGTVTLSSGHP